jgi:hypothetical protein
MGAEQRSGRGLPKKRCTAMQSALMHTLRGPRRPADGQRCGRKAALTHLKAVIKRNEGDLIYDLIKGKVCGERARYTSTAREFTWLG